MGEGATRTSSKRGATVRISAQRVLAANGYLKGQERSRVVVEFGQGSMENMAVNPEFWNKKSVLLTGHTGFKGGWLALWLRSLGANVVGYALPPPSELSVFEAA